MGVPRLVPIFSSVSTLGLSSTLVACRLAGLVLAFSSIFYSFCFVSLSLFQTALSTFFVLACTSPVTFGSVGASHVLVLFLSLSV